MGMPDLWTAISFDHLVMAFGIHIDNLLQETDGEGKPVHTLDDLLDIPLNDSALRQRTLESLAILDIDGRSPQWSGIVVDS
jgi:hypothetical protein